MLDFFMRFIFFLHIVCSWDVIASNFQNINQFLEEVESLSPEVQKSKLNLEVAKQRLIQSAQIPNPEITLGSWQGHANAQGWKQRDYTLAQPIELGGKRGSRLEVSEAELNKNKIDLNALTAEVRLKIIFYLYRLRQLNEEIKLINEAKITFLNLEKNYKKRPQLSPEQTTSLFIFNLSAKDYDLTLEDAKNELNLLEGEIKILTKYDIGDLARIIPQRQKKWPKLNGPIEINSPTLRSISAQVEISEKELNLAKADAWPTINIGPSLTVQNQFGEQANILGFIVTIPLPILNQNNGAKAIARTSINANRKLFEIEKSAQSIRRISLAKSYLSSIKVLESQMSEKGIYSNHTEIEKNFINGLISSQLVIEAHRQIIDNQKLYHLRELKTLDVYYQIVLLEGGRIEGI